MVRLVRDGHTFDVWLEQKPGHQRMFGRDDGGEVKELDSPRGYFAQDLKALLVERLEAGWQRARDPEREVDVDTEPVEPTLEVALRANDDEAAALVYADWYQQRQHPRGELIAIQIALAKQPDDPVLRGAEIALFEREHDRLLGPIGKRRESYHLGVDLTWRNGFVHAARIDGKEYAPAAEELLWEVLRHPSTRFLRELVIGCHAFGDQDNGLMTTFLLHAGPTPPLRKLVLADFDDTHLDNIDISRAWLGDFSYLSDKYPLLEDVVIKGRLIGAQDNARRAGGLHGLALRHCRRFAVQTSGLMAETLASIGDGDWPELRELEVWTGTDEYGCTCGPDDVARFLDRAQLPELRVLRLMNCEFTDELCLVLPAYARRHPLEVIDFSLGTLTDDGADMLIAERSAFAELRSLVVHDNCLTPAGLARLREAGLPIDLAPPYSGQGWRHSYRAPEAQKPERYVSVTE